MQQQETDEHKVAKTPKQISHDRLLAMLTDGSLTKVRTLDLGLIFPSRVDSLMKELGDALAVNSSIRTLSFCGVHPNSIGVVDASLSGRITLLLEKIFSLNPGRTFDVLNLEACNVVSGSLQEIFQFLSNTRCRLLGLNLSRNRFELFEPIAQGLSENIPLQYLSLDSIVISSSGAHEIIGSLLTNRRLLTLSLENTKLGDSAAAQLAEVLCSNSTLRDLNLAKNSIGNEGAAALVAMLKLNTGLNKLDLRANKIESTGISQLPDALEVNVTLSILMLSANRLGNAGCALLGDCIRRNKGLCRLNVENNFIHDMGVREIVDALLDSPGSMVRELGLGKNQIGTVGAQHLARLLSSPLCNLKTLDIASNRFSSEGLHAIFNAIALNNSLCLLFLNDTPLSPLDCERLASSLEKNYCIEGLNLAECSLGNDGAVAISKALQKDCCLKYLILDGNLIGPEGFVAVSTALCDNSHLKFLYMFENDMGDAGARALSKMLRVNTSLEILDLDETMIGLTALTEICGALEENKTMEIICLRMLNMRDSCAEVVAGVISKNSDLVGLLVEQNFFGAEGILTMTEALEGNWSLVRGFNVNYGTGDTRSSLPFVLRNQDKAIRDIKMSLVKHFKKRAESHDDSFLVDVNLISTVWQFYDFPPNIFELNYPFEF
eukprot:TRINITY_DN2365_c0_g1_i1.p1 TRINITY_DN2365_c0_g1~~TRINITY_DN2365_c0_g1_i1.p1  ORF type:complete len:663 (-),score=144.23 TRINITY_DN2365_c0_g1_i1:38-2026(-)